MSGIQKQNININFTKGLDQKSDPKQLPLGKFSLLQNTIFDKEGLLQKSNGSQKIVTTSGASTITTFNGGLVSIGTSLSSISTNGVVTNAGSIQPLALSTKALVRAATSQTTCDSAVEPGGLVCSTWLDSDTNSYYQVSDSITGQTVVPKVQLPSTATISRVFVVGSYFIITYLATVSAATHLQYIAVPIVTPGVPLTAADLSTQVNTLAAGYDGFVYNNTLYISWVSNAGGNLVKITTLTAQLVQGSVATVTGETGDKVTITADSSNSTIWVSIYKASANTIRSVAYNSSLSGQTLAPTTVVSSITINQITSLAKSSVLTLFYEVANTYGFSPNAKTSYVSTNTLTLVGVVGTPAIIIRSVGLASKAAYLNSVGYMLVTYDSTSSYQPTYFLIDASGNIIAKLAYSNAGGYPINQVLPSINVTDSIMQVGYLYKDLLAAVNKTQGVANVVGVYSQTGINLASFALNNSVNVAEIGNNLHISGGFLWNYDGVKVREHGFFVWPEQITVTTSALGGLITAQQYFYQVCYEWTDNQGNIHRSAPSVPITVTTTGTTSTNTINIPTLRLTYKTANKVRLVVYRWSVAQQNYYRVSSITSPLLNNPATDSVTFTDTFADSTILGNDLIYTTGGVVENIAPPACTAVALYKSRFMLIDAENPNQLWYSKPVIQNVPVEFSDLFTIYVSPTTGAQGSTGESKVLSAMDDKLIIFKKDAAYYLTGNGPDITGANNDFTEPIFITSTVGSENPDSIAFQPGGLMLQSDKGIWLLGRDLSTNYIGAPVEDSTTDNLVVGALTIPGTNQIRFSMADGQTLMYDYYYQQWGSFTNYQAISSTLYQGLHTYLNQYGEIYQETPAAYFAGSKPVLIKFTTGWIGLAGLQGYQRAYYFYMLAQFLSPHKIQIEIAYDFAAYPSQSVTILPDNYSNLYGDDATYGDTSPYGGPGDLEQWRIFFQQQKCQAFKITLTEIYDSSYAPSANQGLTISGLNLVFGLKKGWRPIYAKNSRG